MSSRLGFGIWAFVLLSACAKQSQEQTTAATPPARARTTRIDPELLRSGRIATTVVEQKPVAGFIVAVGEVEAPSDAAAAVTPPVTARVRDIAVQRGDVVKKGDRLATLEAGEVAQVAADLKRARAHRIHAERVLSQERRLISQQATSERDFSDAESTLDSARADERAAELLMTRFGKAHENTLDLVAPIAGSVVRVDGVLGAPVEATTPLFRIVDTRRLQVRADVAESDADEVPAGAFATITSTSGSTRCAGRVEAHAPAVEVQTRTVPFRVILEADCGELHERAYVDVSIERRAASGRKLWAVPRDAVVSIDEATLVFVAGNEPNVFEARPVRVADYGGPIVYLEDGVRQGERVVSKGALLLKGEFIRARLE